MTEGSASGPPPPIPTSIEDIRGLGRLWPDHFLHRLGVLLVEDVGNLDLIERACLLDGMLEEQAGRIAARRVVTRLDSVFRLEPLRELRCGWAEVGLERDLR